MLSHVTGDVWSRHFEVPPLTCNGRLCCLLEVLTVQLVTGMNLAAARVLWREILCVVQRLLVCIELSPKSLSALYPG